MAKTKDKVDGFPCPQCEHVAGAPATLRIHVRTHEEAEKPKKAARAKE